MVQKNNLLCVVCSAGGHLTEALLAIEGIDYPKYLVTYKLPHTDKTLENLEYYYIVNPHKYVLKYLINSYQSLRIYLKKKPKYILTTGSGMAIATCLIGKIWGSKVIFLEISARVHNPSLTGRIMYFFSDLFIVQWEPLLQVFPKGVFGGLLF